MIPALHDRAVNRRWAVYWAPPAAHPLWRAGCEWLGRDPERPDESLHAIGPEAWTQAPRRYGFHATLKAPMRLRDPADEPGFLAAVATLAARHADFEMPRLQVARLGDFIALRPVDEPPPAHPLRRLADDCVESLDAWRAPAHTSEIARHLDHDVPDPEREARVRRWGYPHVFEHWRFHLTLSDPMAGHRAAEGLSTAAERHFASVLAAPLPGHGLCVFTEDKPGAAFRLAHRFALGVTTRSPAPAVR
jgi:hypothetical protein